MASRHHPHHSKTFQEEIPPTPKNTKNQDEEKKSNLLLILGDPETGLQRRKTKANFSFLVEASPHVT